MTISRTIAAGALVALVLTLPASAERLHCTLVAGALCSLRDGCKLSFSGYKIVIDTTAETFEHCGAFTTSTCDRPVPMTRVPTEDGSDVWTSVYGSFHRTINLVGVEVVISGTAITTLAGNHKASGSVLYGRCVREGAR